MNWKIRSEEAIACSSRLYVSPRREMGCQNWLTYWVKADRASRGGQASSPDHPLLREAEWAALRGRARLDWGRLCEILQQMFKMLPL